MDLLATSIALPAALLAVIVLAALRRFSHQVVAVDNDRQRESR